MMPALFSYMISLFEMKILNSMSVAEIFSFVLIILSVFTVKNIKYDRNAFIITLFTVWVLICLIFYTGRNYFSTSSYLNNTFRLLLYFVGFLTIPFYLIKYNRLKTFFLHLTYVTIAISIIGIIEFFLIQLNVKPDFRVSQLTSSEFIPKFTTRISSIFNEPAHLSIFLGTSLILIFKYQSLTSGIKLANLTRVLVFINLLISMSLVGFTILLFLILMFTFKKQVLNPAINYVKRIFIAIIALLFVFVIVVQVDFLNESIVERATTASKLEDTSGNQRLIAPFEYAAFVVTKHPATGIGMGQLANYYQKIRVPMKYNYLKDKKRRGGVNNIYSTITIQTGLIGLFLFIFFTNSLFKSDKYLLLMFVLLCFSWGFFNTPLFWFYLYIGKSLILIQNNSIIREIGIINLTNIKKFGKMAKRV
jgi:hypothetical protein